MTLPRAIDLGGGNPKRESKPGKELIRDWNELPEHRKLYQERCELQRDLKKGVRDY